MYFICKISDLLLLFHIKSTFVSTISYNVIPKLSTGKLMKNKTFFTCIDHFSIVESCVFFCKLSFFCKFLKSFQYIIVYLLCSIVICHSCSHWYAVILYTL